MLLLFYCTGNICKRASGHDWAINMAPALPSPAAGSENLKIAIVVDMLVINTVFETVCMTLNNRIPQCIIDRGEHNQDLMKQRRTIYEKAFWENLCDSVVCVNCFVIFCLC